MTGENEGKDLGTPCLRVEGGGEGAQTEFLEERKYVLITGSLGGIVNFYRLRGYLDRMVDSGLVADGYILGDSVGPIVEMQFRDDPHAREKFSKLEKFNGMAFIGRLEVTPQFTDKEIKQIKERFQGLGFERYLLKELTLQAGDTQDLEGE